MANNTFDKAIDFVFLGLLSLHVLPGRFVRIRHYGILSPIRRDETYVVIYNKRRKVRFTEEDFFE